MAKVYIPQIPHRRDNATSKFVPTVDISSAASHGELVVLLPPNAPFHSSAGVLEAIGQQLKDYDYEAGDSIIALGDPFLIAVSCGMLGKLGNFSLLKWERNSNQYIKYRVVLDHA